jgi:anti-sigma factor RsiW
MRCRHSRRLFSRHLDGRLGDSERHALDGHLSGCARCRAELVRWEVPSRALRAMGPALLPDGLAERGWRAALAGAGPGAAPSFEERFVWAARRAAAVGAVAAALVWGGLLWGDQESAEVSAELLPLDAAEMAFSLLGDPGVEAYPEGPVDDD